MMPPRRSWLRARPSAGGNSDGDPRPVARGLSTGSPELERFFTLSSDLLCVTARDHVVGVNPAFERTLGYTRDELESRPYLDIVEPQDREHVRSLLAELPGGLEPARYENRVVCKDGSWRWIEWSVTSHRGLYYAAGRDVTERRQEQDQLRLAQERLSALAEQQAALRRVATLVARGVAPEVVFATVAEEMGRCLNVVGPAVSRYDDDSAVLLALHFADPVLNELVPIGDRFPLDGDNVAVRVLATGLAARMDRQQEASGAIGERMRALGVGSIVAVPIVVGGRVWGFASAGSAEGEPMPPDTEARMSDFADLVATAIANAATRDELRESRDRLRVLADQQAGLRRVATLVARGIGPSEVFSAVADEVCRCLSFDNATVNRYEDDAMVILAIANNSAVFRDTVSAGERFPLDGDYVGARVFRSGRPARMDSYENAVGPVAARLRERGIRYGVGVPIVVGGRLWGMLGGVSGSHELPADTESRMCDLAELIATAIANAATRADLQASRDSERVLAEHQAALRRVATLVAREAPPSEVFNVVAEEMARCLDAHNATIARYENDALVIAAIAGIEPAMPNKPVVGDRFPLDGHHVGAEVLQTGRPARMDTHRDTPGSTAARIRELGVRSVVGAPIVVGGRPWGVAAVASSRAEPLPADTEARICDFAELVATAIANAATRAELVASRARIVAAADDARRRLERDLHDGAQQRLISLGLHARMAESLAQQTDLKKQLADLASGLNNVSTELQEISRGIHPAILSEGGLGPALKSLGRRSVVPVSYEVAIERRLPDAVEIAAYYVVAEALANAAKHAHASQVDVRAETTDATLRLSIQDDGIGGADPRKGSGLIGLKDRVEAVGGRMRVTSPAGSGTLLHITVPLDGQSTQ